MMLVDRLDDTDFPTFVQFQRMLRDFEALPAPAQVGATVRVRLPQRLVVRTSRLVVTGATRDVGDRRGLSVWADGQTKCVHGVELFRVCRACGPVVA